MGRPVSLCRSSDFNLQLTSLNYSTSRYIPANYKLVEMVLALAEPSQLVTKKASSKAAVRSLEFKQYVLLLIMHLESQKEDKRFTVAKGDWVFCLFRAAPCKAWHN